MFPCSPMYNQSKYGRNKNRSKDSSKLFLETSESLKGQRFPYLPLSTTGSKVVLEAGAA